MTICLVFIEVGLYSDVRVQFHYFQASQICKITKRIKGIPKAKSKLKRRIQWHQKRS